MVDVFSKNDPYSEQSEILQNPWGSGLELGPPHPLVCRKRRLNGDP
jgi:hypothetical protein